jgi:predicted RNA-binding protein with RPS1 domain
MTNPILPKYTVIECTVIGHRSYGLIVRLDSGESGFVDRSYIADTVLSIDEWPRVNTRIRGILLGYTRDGRVRVSARRRDRVLIESLNNPESALHEWQMIESSTVDDTERRREFYRSPNAHALLKWALANPSNSVARQRAVELIAEAPSDLKRDLMGKSDDI